MEKHVPAEIFEEKNHSEELHRKERQAGKIASVTSTGMISSEAYKFVQDAPALWKRQ